LIKGCCLELEDGLLFDEHLTVGGLDRPSVVVKVEDYFGEQNLQILTFFLKLRKFFFN
jgi:hypothetical protein